MGTAGWGRVGVLSPWALGGRDPRAGPLENGNGASGLPVGALRPKARHQGPRPEGDSVWGGGGALWRCEVPILSLQTGPVLRSGAVSVRVCTRTCVGVRV